MHTPSRVPALLVALAAALVAAFVAAPPALAAIGSTTGFADERQFTDGVRAAFVEYWRSGERAYSPRLREVVDYWFRYHVIKAVIAGLLLIVFVALGVVLWKAFVRTRRRRTALAAGGVLATVFALFSLTVVMANVQGAAAPFASLLPMLTEGPADGDLAGVLEQVRSSGSGGDAPPALDVMIGDFARYHTAMAAIAAVVAVGLIGAGALLWKRLSATDHRPTRRVLGSFVALSAAVSVAVIVIAVANATTAADPEPALMAFFDGGW